MTKSVSPARLNKAVQKFSSAAVSPEHAIRLPNGQQIFIRDGEHCWIVRVTDITLIQCEGNYTHVHFGSSRAMLHHSLKHLQERLDPTLFFRANRNSIFNLRYVKEIIPMINGGLV
jgi:two-component system LytT family response regulator